MVRNALIPVVTLVALQIPRIFTGAIITEQIFRVPGIGSLLIASILANDTPVVMAITFVFSALVVLFNLIADLALRLARSADLVPMMGPGGHRAMSNEARVETLISAPPRCARRSHSCGTRRGAASAATGWP